MSLLVLFLLELFLSFEQDPAFLAGLDGVELPIGRATLLTFVIHVHMEAAKSHLTSELTSNYDLEVSLSPLEELSDDVHDGGTVLVVHDHLHLITLEHRKAVSPGSHVVGHGHGVPLEGIKVATREVVDFVVQDAFTHRLRRVKEELEVRDLKETSFLSWVGAHGVL